MYSIIDWTAKLWICKRQFLYTYFKAILDKMYRKGGNDLQTKKLPELKMEKLRTYEYNRSYLLLISIFKMPEIHDLFAATNWPIQPYNRNKWMHASITSNKVCKKDIFFWL